MKARETILIFAAFTLVFMTLCVVTFTGSYSNTGVNQPIHRLSSDSGTTGTDHIIHNSTDNSDNPARKLKAKRTTPPANEHPGSLRTNTRSSNFRVMNQKNNSQLKAIELNGRVYLENTTGAEICENNNNNEGKIKTIE